MTAGVVARELLLLALHVNLLMGAGVVLVAATRAPRRMSARQRLRLAEGTFLLALLLPGAVRLVPDGALPVLPPQVWSGIALRHAASAVLSAVPGATVAAPGAAACHPLLVAGFALLVGAALLGMARRIRTTVLLHRSLRRLPAIRTIGRVSVVASAGDPVPYSAWILGRAWVVIPEGMLGDPVRLGLAVRHELEHHRQRHTIWLPFFEAVRALCPWNPALSRWARLFGELQELACDERLIACRRVDAAAYARCLVDVAELAVGARLRPATAGLGPGMSASVLRRRIAMITSPPCPARPAAYRVFAALTVCLMASAAGALPGGAPIGTLSLEEARGLAAGLGSPGCPVLVDAQVLGRLNLLLGTDEGREFLRGAMARMPEHAPEVERRLAAADLPSMLAAVPFVESGFRNNEGVPTEPTLAPGVRGAGLWMFIPATARRYGLEVDPARGVDERLDVARETDAAIAYLKDLHARFGDWRLALAAYNQGERHVERAIDDGGVRDAAALAAQGRLNDYVATVMAGAIVMRNPRLVR